VTSSKERRYVMQVIALHMGRGFDRNDGCIMTATQLSISYTENWRYCFGDKDGILFERETVYPTDTKLQGYTNR
jgi:hypothetical protein